MSDQEIYQGLAREFDHLFHDTRGGASFDYVTGEQVVTRLNEELGFLNWSFRIVKDGIHAEADECWALGELTVTLDGRTVVKQQYGSQKVKRSRASGVPLDIGFDLKGAATDALKKTATLIGVGLYLTEKDAPAQQQGPTPLRGQQDAPAGGASTCEECGEPLTETRFKDGTTWGPDQLAVFGRRKHSRVLCMLHYREANQAKRRAEEALQQAPF